MQSPAALALAWALIHFLWEGAAIAAILAAILWLGRDWPSRWRYAAAAVALFALPLAFGITAALYFGPDRTEVTRFIREAYPVTAAPSSLDIDLPVATWRDYLAWLTPVWMLGVLLCYIRSLGGWLAVRRLRVSGICAAPERWHARLKLPASVPLLESCRIDVPMVVGLLRPAILVPVGFAAGLAPSQVEAILLARDGAHPPPRPAGQPAAELHRGPALLPPRGLVDLERGARRAGALLRRPGGRGHRRSAWIRRRAHGPRTRPSVPKNRRSPPMEVVS